MVWFCMRGSQAYGASNDKFVRGNILGTFVLSSFLAILRNNLIYSQKLLSQTTFFLPSSGEIKITKILQIQDFIKHAIFSKLSFFCFSTLCPQFPFTLLLFTFKQNINDLSHFVYLVLKFIFFYYPIECLFSFFFVVS